MEFDEFSKFCGTKVTHKDLRKIYTTDIKYHKSQVYKYMCMYTSSTFIFFQTVRDGESLVAGHSAATMADFYDPKTKNTTQKVIQSLNHKYGMLGNVED